MNHKKNLPTKKAPKKPFPWRCHECGEHSVKMETITYEAQAKHDGRLHTFTIPELEIPICQECEAKVFTESVDEQINIALCNHLELLTHLQIRENVERLCSSQKEIASRLRIAESTFSRWLNGFQLQSRSLDTLLRIYFAFPIVRRILDKENIFVSLGLSDIQSELPLIEPQAVPSERRFRPPSKDNAWDIEISRCQRAQTQIENSRTTWGANCR